MEKARETNTVTIEGIVETEPIFSHEIKGEKIYNINLVVNRQSGMTDNLVVAISERLTDINSITITKKLRVTGQLRSYNKRNEEKGKSELKIFVFAKEIHEINSDRISDTNEITLKGFISKEPTYRKTPLGREIAEVLLAVNRQYGKADYIPCILWGRNARFASTLAVGSQIIISGRVQSRNYEKKIGDIIEEHTTYEVSAITVELVDELINNEQQ